MQILTKDDLKHRKEQFKRKVIDGNVFIYPTDTIYGLGCNATIEKSINRVREIKGRPKEKPFSILVPSKDWVRKNCEINDEIEEWLEKLPGPYTLLLRLKNKDAIDGSVNDNNGTIGVRIPAHWISDAVAELKIPIITSSVNLRGNDYMTSIDDIDESIKPKVDFAVYEDEISGKPSTLVNLADVKIESVKDREIIS